MSQENVDALRAVYAEWERGNFRAAVDLYDPHVLYVLRPEFPEAGVYLGKERLREYMLGFLAAWDDVTMTAQEFIEADGSVVVAIRQRGLGQASGAPSEMHYFHVWTFRGRSVTRLEITAERAEAFETVGLSE